MTSAIFDPISLGVRFAGDGRNGEHVRAWCRAAANVGRHGWALVQAIASEPTTHGAPAVADSILGALDKLGMIERGKRELWFAPEIRAFGVGGMLGDRLDRADYPCLFYWIPTRRLQKIDHWIATACPADVVDFASQLYAFAAANPGA